MLPIIIGAAAVLGIGAYLYEHNKQAQPNQPTPGIPPNPYPQVPQIPGIPKADGHPLDPIYPDIPSIPGIPPNAPIPKPIDPSISVLPVIPGLPSIPGLPNIDPSIIPNIIPVNPPNIIPPPGPTLQIAKVTTTDPSPAGDLIIRDAPEGVQIGTAAKDSLLQVLNWNAASMNGVPWAQVKSLVRPDGTTNTGYAAQQYLVLQDSASMTGERIKRFLYSKV
jgi:hypothetical protein